MGVYVYTRRNKVKQAIDGRWMVAFEFAYKEFYGEPGPSMKRKLGQLFAAADRAAQKTGDIKYGVMGGWPVGAGEEYAHSVIAVGPQTSTSYDSGNNVIGRLVKVAHGKYRLDVKEELVA